jgi:ferredoxin
VWGAFEVPHGKRLVLALADEAGLDQLHACGGNACCTTCRVEFMSGELELMAVAEQSVLAARGLSGIRLSCQILCDHDMSVGRSVASPAADAMTLANGPRMPFNRSRWSWFRSSCGVSHDEHLDR